MMRRPIRTRAARRGVAIETAIIAMLLTFALCLMLISVSLSAGAGRRVSFAAAERRVEIDCMGEAYRAAVAAGEGEHFAPNQEGYAFDVGPYRFDREGGDYRVLRGDTVVLTFTLDGNNVTSWQYP